MKAIHVTKETFESEVLNAKVPVLVDFWASWCGPCQMIAPTLDEIADEFDSVKICKINVDEQGELARQFAVLSIPTLLVFNEGKVTNKSLGAIPKDDILDILGL